jgi:hypothetical protein
MAKFNSAVLSGKLSVKSGVKAKPVYGGIAHSGWFLKVDDENGRYMTGMPVKTMDESVAKQLGSAPLSEATVVGYIKTENWGQKDGPASWVTVLYVEEVESIQDATISEPEL